MKKLAFMALAALSIGLGACQDKETTPTPNPNPNPTPNPKTEMEVIVGDMNNNPQIGATVELYKSQADFDSRDPNKRVGGFLQTNSFGRCKISSLEPITYFFYVESQDGKLNNKMDVTYKTLEKDKLTPVVVKLQ